MRFTSQALRPAFRQVLRVAVALTLTASPAAAQFTAVVAPPKAKVAASGDAVAQATPGARSDSAGHTALSDMRAWVDSAAGINAPDTATRRDSTRDSSAVWSSSAGDVSTPAKTPTASDAGNGASGAKAPDTATMLPTVAIAGLAMLAVGAWLLRRDQAEQA